MEVKAMRDKKIRQETGLCWMASVSPLLTWTAIVLAMAVGVICGVVEYFSQRRRPSSKS